MATLNEIENFLNIEIGDKTMKQGKMQAGINKYYYYENMYYIVELSKSKYMICSDNKETRQLLKSYWWRVSTDGYAKTSTNNTTKHYHQLYLHYEAGLVCDHANRKRFDNRHDNLRVVTRRQNMRNLTKNKTNTSEENGISRYTNNGISYWQSRIYNNEGKRLSKSFNINKLGEEEAKRQAIEQRMQWNKLYDYTGE